MFKRKPRQARFVRVLLEVRDAQDHRWDGWYPPSVLPFLVTAILQGRRDQVASLVVSTLTKRDAEVVGYAYSNQLPEGAVVE